MLKTKGKIQNEVDHLTQRGRFEASPSLPWMGPLQLPPHGQEQRWDENRGRVSPAWHTRAAVPAAVTNGAVPQVSPTPGLLSAHGH